MSVSFVFLTALAGCSASNDHSLAAGADQGWSQASGEDSASRGTERTPANPTTNPPTVPRRDDPPTPGAPLGENDFVDTSVESTSTFGVDVDTGSYSLMRRWVESRGYLAPYAVRPEEFINYFRYDYPPPTDDRPFAVQIEGAPSPFGAGLHLMRVALQGRRIPDAARAQANLVFLVDVSGSMMSADKLGLVQYSLKQLTKRLLPTDTLSIVTYAGTDTVLLPPTPVEDKSKVLDAIDGLTVGGFTNGAGGIRQAYAQAEKTKTPGSINRVVWCTDGDFNVGATGDSLVYLIEKERDRGITLTTLGFGTGNYDDAQLEALADHGNGNYAYIDKPGEANRVLGENLVSTLQVIAKDVKVQVAFDPSVVARYRLVGYENRVLGNKDFEDDGKDAGELGAGHSVTAFYEVELTAQARSGPAKDARMATVRLRYKEPEGSASTEFSTIFRADRVAPSFEAASIDFRFAAAVAEFAEILRYSKHSTGARFDDVLGIAAATAGDHADRKEFLTLVPSAKSLYR